MQKNPESTKEELRSKRNDWLQAAAWLHHETTCGFFTSPEESQLQSEVQGRSRDFRLYLTRLDEGQIYCRLREALTKQIFCHLAMLDPLLEPLGAGLSEKRWLGFPTGLPLFVTVAQIERWT